MIHGIVLSTCNVVHFQLSQQVSVFLSIAHLPTIPVFPVVYWKITLATVSFAHHKGVVSYLFGPVLAKNAPFLLFFTENTQNKGNLQCLRKIGEVVRESGLYCSHLCQWISPLSKIKLQWVLNYHRRQRLKWKQSMRTDLDMENIPLL